MFTIKNVDNTDRELFFHDCQMSVERYTCPASSKDMGIFNVNVKMLHLEVYIEFCMFLCVYTCRTCFTRGILEENTGKNKWRCDHATGK